VFVLMAQDSFPLPRGASISPFAIIPYARAPTERHRLGAAKEEKLRARQIEGRTDHRSEMRANTGGDSATRIRMRKNRHCRIAVPPAEFTVR
jgi:hypothetical protein